ncbi:hypothetical protein ACRAWD_20500 [Caulobacter segnis]
MGQMTAIIFLPSPSAVDEASAVGFEGFARETRRRARGLLESGVTPGETIAVFLPLSAARHIRRCWRR